MSQSACLWFVLALSTIPQIAGAQDVLVPADEKILLDYNQSSSSFGWQWSDNANGYNAEGWILQGNDYLGTGENYSWGWGPLTFNKQDYGAANKVTIDRDRAPSTATGNSLKVFDPPGSTDNQSTWWIWYDGKPLSKRGITNSKTNRMSFYLKTSGVSDIVRDGGVHSLAGYNFDIGTYLCWYREDGSTAYGTGDGCPYEGVGNQHYYHSLIIESGAWIHVLLDQHPQHLRGDKNRVPNDPSFVQAGKHYFEHLNQMYMEISRKQAASTSMNIDEISFFSKANENDESVTSLWVGYWPSNDEWRMGFSDMSFDSVSDVSVGTYEIRWSLQPIDNTNYRYAIPVRPLLYTGPDYVGDTASGEYLIRRPNSWDRFAFTTFRLPCRNLSGEVGTIYFAVKDVSKKGKHAGLRWPWNTGDGHDAPNDLVKTIEYPLKPKQ